MATCKEHEPVKLLTKEHGDVWICTSCKSVSKKDVFTDEEIEVMVEFIKTLKARKK